MLKKITFSICLLFQVAIISAQNIGIGTLNPHNSAKLHIEDANRGLLIPNVSLVAVANGINPVNLPATGLLVWNTNAAVTNGAGVGFYYWTGSIWEKLAANTGTATTDAWLTLGNAGTASGTNFLGTTDDQALDIRTNNVVKTRITTKGQIEVLNTGQSIFIGEEAGASDDLGSNRNVFVGHRSGNATIGGSRNTGVGYLTLENNTIGTQNVAIGTEALQNNTEGNFNTALGPSTLESNIDGNFNVAIGLSALQDNISGNNNIAIGQIALEHHTSGGNNLAIGFSTLNENLTGYNNIALGSSTLRNNIAGFENVGIGAGALRDNIGNRNVGIGAAALSDNLTGEDNVAVGQTALSSNTTGSDNVGLGFRALALNTTGENNTAIGQRAGGTNTIGSDNTFIGQGADADFNNLNNVTAIGNGARVATSNSLILGGTGVNAVNVGIGTSAPSERLEVCGNAKIVGQIQANSSNLTAGLTCSSDKRLKKNITNYDNALETISLLKGKQYNWRNEEFTDRGFDERIKYGFIAQEIEKVLPNIVYEDQKGFKSVDYIQVIPILTNAVQEQQNELEEVKEQNKLLQAKLEAITAENKTQTSSLTAMQGELEQIKELLNIKAQK